MMATRQAVLITSIRASASSAAHRRPSLFMATSSSFVTLCIRMRLEWKVKRSGPRNSRWRKSAGTSVSIVVLELGTIWPIRKCILLISMFLLGEGLAFGCLGAERSRDDLGHSRRVHLADACHRESRHDRAEAAALQLREHRKRK